MTAQPKRLYLIDGSGYIYRAYFAIRHLSNSKGLATNAIYGFTNMLLKVVREEKPDHLAVIFDAKGPSFRKEIYPAYKANRVAMPDDLVPQIPLIKEVVRGFRMPAIELAGYEADDIIATLARRFTAEGMEITVVTGDKDLMQIVGERVRLYDTMREKFSGLPEVAERFGGPPEKVADVLALAGDTSDNIPGVPGIGEKTARELIAEFGSLEDLLANIDKVKGAKRQENLRTFADQARLSRQLVLLREDLPLEVDYDDFALSAPDREALTALFKEMEFHKLLQEFSADTRTTGEGYHCVFTPEAFAAMVVELEQAGRFCLDTETTSLDPLRAEVVGLSFAVRPHEAWYVPLAHRYLGVPQQLDRQTVLERLRPLLEDPAVPKCGQNLKYDVLVLRRAGIRLAGLGFDTMIASYLAQPAAKSHSLDTMAAELLGHQMITYGELTGSGKKQIGFEEVECDRAAIYSAEDADITLRLMEKLAPRLAETGQDKLFREVEMALLPVLIDMEWAGVRIDPVFLRQLSGELAAKLTALETKIHEMCGGPFNIGSPKQLGEVLFGRLKLARGKRTKTGWSTDVEVLTKLAEEHEVCARILDYRSLAKLTSTYTDNLPRLIHPGNRAHPHLLQPDGDRHGTALLQRPQPAEHPHPHRGGEPHPRGLHPGRGEPPALRRLLTGGTAHPRPPGRRAGAGGEFRPRRGYSPAYRQRDLRRLSRPGHRRDAPAGEDDQLRRYLRDERLRPGQGTGDRPPRGAGLHRQLLRPLPESQGIHGPQGRRGAGEAVCHHPARPALRHPGNPQPERRGARLCRAQRHQLPDPGLGRRHHQGSDGQRPPAPAAGRAGRPHGPAGA